MSVTSNGKSTIYSLQFRWTLWETQSLAPPSKQHWQGRSPIWEDQVHMGTLPLMVGKKKRRERQEQTSEECGGLSWS